jgi:hypothetical protein
MPLVDAGFVEVKLEYSVALAYFVIIVGGM